MLPVARARGFPLRGGVDLRMVVALQAVRHAATHASVFVALCVAQRCVGEPITRE